LTAPESSPINKSPLAASTQVEVEDTDDKLPLGTLLKNVNRRQSRDIFEHSKTKKKRHKLNLIIGLNN
jgi:hypothetical protein